MLALWNSVALWLIIALSPGAVSRRMTVPSLGDLNGNIDDNMALLQSDSFSEGMILQTVNDEKLSVITMIFLPPCLSTSQHQWDPGCKGFVSELYEVGALI